MMFQLMLTCCLSVLIKRVISNSNSEITLQALTFWSTRWVIDFITESEMTANNLSPPGSNSHSVEAAKNCRKFSNLTFTLSPRCQQHTKGIWKFPKKCWLKVPTGLLLSLCGMIVREPKPLSSDLSIASS